MAACQGACELAVCGRVGHRGVVMLCEVTTPDPQGAGESIEPVWYCEEARDEDRRRGFAVREMATAATVEAAPDLLAALKDALDELESLSYARYVVLEDKCRAAIAKAEGR